MGWAAKLKAEERLNRFWNDELMASEKMHRPKLRTTFDTLDRVAMLIAVNRPPIPKLLQKSPA